MSHTETQVFRALALQQMVASSLQLEKACTQQQRPNTAKNKINKEVNLEKKEVSGVTLVK